MANNAYTDYYFVGSKKELDEFIGIISVKEVREELGITEMLSIEEDYSPEVYRMFLSTVTDWREYSEDFDKIIKENMLTIRMHWICEELSCNYFAKSIDGDFYFPFRYLFEADLVSTEGDIFKEYFETESALIAYANEMLKKEFDSMAELKSYVENFNNTHKDDNIIILKAIEK